MKQTVKVASTGFLGRLAKVAGATVLKRKIDGDVTYVTYSGKVKGQAVHCTDGWAFWGEVQSGYSLTTVPESLWSDEDDVLREILPITFDESDVLPAEEFEAWRDFYALLRSAPKSALRSWYTSCETFETKAYPNLRQALFLLRQV